MPRHAACAGAIRRWRLRPCAAVVSDGRESSGNDAGRFELGDARPSRSRARARPPRCVARSPAPARTAVGPVIAEVDRRRQHARGAVGDRDVDEGAAGLRPGDRGRRRRSLCIGAHHMPAASRRAAHSSNERLAKMASRAAMSSRKLAAAGADVDEARIGEPLSASSIARTRSGQCRSACKPRRKIQRASCDAIESAERVRHRGALDRDRRDAETEYLIGVGADDVEAGAQQRGRDEPAATVRSRAKSAAAMPPASASAVAWSPKAVRGKGGSPPLRRERHADPGAAPEGAGVVGGAVAVGAARCRSRSRGRRPGAARRRAASRRRGRRARARAGGRW